MVACVVLGVMVTVGEVGSIAMCTTVGLEVIEVIESK